MLVDLNRDALSNQLLSSEQGFLELESKQGLLLRFLFPAGYDRKF